MNAAEKIHEDATTFSETSWLQARNYADALGRPPASVESLIRKLLVDAETDPWGLSEVGRYFLGRFFASRSFQSPYFHAISLFKKERLQPEDEPFITRDFLESFSGAEHAVLTGLIFLHRMARRGVDRDLIAGVDEWLQRGVNLGWYIGKALKPVGTEAGMLAGSLRWIGLLPFAKRDPQGLKKYMKHLKSQNLATTDPNYEFDQWYCTSLQVGLILLQRLGFEMSKLVPLMRAMTTNSPIPSQDPTERAYRVVEVWTRYLLEVRKAPAVPLQPTYYLSQEKMDQISEQVLMNQESRIFNWLSAHHSFLTPDTAPQLFCGHLSDDSAQAGADGESGELEEGSTEVLVLQDEQIPPLASQVTGLSDDAECVALAMPEGLTEEEAAILDE
jgi:hypothetical protein